MIFRNDNLLLAYSKVNWGSQKYDWATAGVVDGATSIPGAPEDPVSKKYTAGLEMGCPGGACLKLGPAIPSYCSVASPVPASTRPSFAVLTWALC